MKTQQKTSLAGCIGLGIGFALIISIALSIWVGMSYMEASSFNAVTGKDVSTWQAMWIELRVQETSK